MHDTLEYPTIDADKAPVVATSAAVAVISIKEAALARFTATETALRALADRYSRVAFNVTTPKGLAEAKAARNELREQGRYAVQRVEKAIKDDVNDLKRVMAVEAERLIAIVKPVEDAVDAQIKVREEQIAAEKAERERIEAERKAKHMANMATLRSYVAQGKGKTSEQLEAAALKASQIELDPAEWEEFHGEAVIVRLQIHEELSRMAAEAKTREMERAEADWLRAENARIAAELAEQRKALEAERAKAAALAESDRLERLANEKRDAAMRAMAIEIQAAQLEAQQQAAEELAKPVPPVTVADDGADAGVTAPTEPLPIEGQADEYDTLTLDELCAMLGFDLSQRFVCHVLGIKLSATDPTRFLTTELPRIFAGLHNHLTKLENETC